MRALVLDQGVPQDGPPPLGQGPERAGDQPAVLAVQQPALRVVPARAGPAPRLDVGRQDGAPRPGPPLDGRVADDRQQVRPPVVAGAGAGADGLHGPGEGLGDEVLGILRGPAAAARTCESGGTVPPVEEFADVGVRGAGGVRPPEPPDEVRVGGLRPLGIGIGIGFGIGHNTPWVFRARSSADPFGQRQRHRQQRCLHMHGRGAGPKSASGRHRSRGDAGEVGGGVRRPEGLSGRRVRR